MRLIQLVPELPPATTGVGDYALVLAERLGERGWRTTFVAATERRDRTLTPFDVIGLPAGDRASALVEALERGGAATVLLHYSGYGYAKRGCPWWLLRGLQKWTRGARDRRLVIMFHELFMTFPELLRRVRPSQSSFWLTPVHREVARGLARCADICLTNCDLYSSVLRQWTRDGALGSVVPVFSNVGEPTGCVGFSRRPPVAVLFGLAPRRLAVYQRLEAFLPALHTASVGVIVDIGPPIAGLPATIGGVEIRASGVLPADQVSGVLSRARLGLLHYPVAKLTKSGVFAAIAAHGVVPVVSNQSGGGAFPSGLRPWQQYLLLQHLPVASASQLTVQTLERISINVCAWYSKHAAQRAVEVFHLALQRPASERHDSAQA